MLVIDTADVGDADGFGYYREVVASAHVGMEIRADRPADFWARLCTSRSGTWR